MRMFMKSWMKMPSGSVWRVWRGAKRKNSHVGIIIATEISMAFHAGCSETHSKTI